MVRSRFTYVNCKFVRYFEVVVWNDRLVHFEANVNWLIGFTGSVFFSGMVVTLPAVFFSALLSFDGGVKIGKIRNWKVFIRVSLHFLSDFLQIWRFYWLFWHETMLFLYNQSSRGVWFLLWNVGTRSGCQLFFDHHLAQGLKQLGYFESTLVRPILNSKQLVKSFHKTIEPISMRVIGPEKLTNPIHVKVVELNHVDQICDFKAKKIDASFQK